MNKIFLIGNLTKDPEVYDNEKGNEFCTFSIAVNRSYTNKAGERDTDFFNCIAGGATCKYIVKYAGKGCKVALVGSIENRTYEDDEGKKCVTSRVMVLDTEILSYAKPKADVPSEEPESKQTTIKGKSKYVRKQ